MPKTHPPYHADFRTDAVNLLIHSGRPLKHVAAELGLMPNTLRAWRDKALGKSAPAKGTATDSPQRSTVSLAGAMEQIQHLQKENEYLRRQREILKKAMGILSEAPRNVLP